MTAAADNKNYLIRLLAVVLTGILAGLSGMVLALILHAIRGAGLTPWSRSRAAGNGRAGGRDGGA